MRFHVVVITILLGLIIGIGVPSLLVPKMTIIPEETPVQALKRTVKEVVVREKPATQERDFAVETSETVRVAAQPTVCTTTLKQQEDLRALGFDPCLTTLVSVR